MRKGPATAAFTPLLLAAALFAPAADAATIRVKAQERYESHRFTAYCDKFCRLEVTIRRDGKVIRRLGPRRELFTATVYYGWSCSRTGRHTWTARSEDDTASGTFRVRRCTKRRDRKVGRARASYADASAQSDNVYVSSVRCRPTRVPRGPAARWTCIVTWNDHLRECVDRDRLRFWWRVRFGVRREGFELSSRRLGCRYY